MYHSYFTGMPWGRFKEFISPEADRFTILKELLDEAGLDNSALDIAGNRHILIVPPPPERPAHAPQQKLSLQQTPLLAAHYDRVPGSPGANDNSAAVFILLETAIKLKSGGAKNWAVIFTDKEELEAGESIQAQGSYTLALDLKNHGLENPKIFSFDACGAGDTLIISTTAEHLLKKEGGMEKLQRSVMELRQLALDTARNLGMAKVLLAPTPFSDDAGFLRAGTAAQTITMLPSAECIRLVSELRRNPALADTFISAGPRQNTNTNSIPETWRSLNSPSDSYLRLTPEHFRAVLRFAEALCRG